MSRSTKKLEKLVARKSELEARVQQELNQIDALKKEIDTLQTSEIVSFAKTQNLTFEQLMNNLVVASELAASDLTLEDVRQLLVPTSAYDKNDTLKQEDIHNEN